MKERSGGRCERRLTAIAVNYVVRCPNKATDLHHRLPRSRGGKLLDQWGETVHLMHLCHTCHMDIHRNPKESMDNGNTIDGHVLSGSEGKPVYHGTNRMLSLIYPKPEEHDDEGHVRHSQTHEQRGSAGHTTLREVDQDS